MHYLRKEQPGQTLTEEFANALTHGFGLVMSVVALIVMLMASLHLGESRALLSSAVFGGALIALYGVSTLYHAVSHAKAKRILHVLDHIMIYFLIAGSYTPFMLVGLGGSKGLSLFATVWGLALSGAVFKLFYTGRLEKLSITIYIAMGWLALVAIKPIYAALGFDGFMWLLAGGGFYTFGTVFYALDGRVRYAHSVWHLFVLMGSACHVIALLFYVLK